MGRAAHAARGVVELTGVGLGQGHKLGHVTGLDAGADHHHIRRGADHGHRHEVFHHVVGQLGVNAGIDAMRAGIANNHGVAVGRRAGCGFGAQHATGAGLVVDNHWLAEFARQALGNDASGDVRAVARRAGDHPADGLVRVGLGQGAAAPKSADEGGAQSGLQNSTCKVFHGRLRVTR